MRRKILFFMTFLLVAVSTGYGQQFRDDPGVLDTVYIDSVVSFNIDGSGIVPVYFYNDEPLAGIEVTLIWDSPDIVLDSFSFVDSRVAQTYFHGYSTDTNTVIIYSFPVSPEPLIQPGNGLLGKLYFSYQLTITPQLVTIDSVTIIDNDVMHTVMFSDENNNAFKPQFKKGYLDIQEYTSCCIGDRGNVDNDESDLVNVADVTYLVAFLFQGGAEPVCTPEGNVDGDPDELVNIADLTYLIAFLWRGGDPPPPCQ